jgi:hypothetical protein
MQTVTAKQLDQFLIDGGHLLVTRDTRGEVIECRIEPTGNKVYPGMFAIYAKAGLVVPSAANCYAISAVGRERIQRAYTRDARFTKRKRLVANNGIVAIRNADALGSNPGERADLGHA